MPAAPPWDSGLEPLELDEALGLLAALELLLLLLLLLHAATAAIFVVATATIAAYIGLGGLGRFIFDGLASYQYGPVAGGALLVVILAVLVLGFFALLSRLVVPAGLRGQSKTE